MKYLFRLTSSSALFKRISRFLAIVVLMVIPVTVTSRVSYRVQFGHTDRISAIAFSSDGKSLVTGSFDSTVKVHDTLTGDLLMTIKGHIAPVRAVAFLPGRPVVISGAWDNSIRVTNWKSGKLIVRLTTGNSPVTSLTVTDNGTRLFAATLSGIIYKWNISTWKKISSGEIASGGINNMVMGRRLLYGSSPQGTVYSIDPTSLKVEKRYDVRETMHSLIYCRDRGRVIAAAGSRILILKPSLSLERTVSLKEHVVALSSCRDRKYELANTFSGIMKISLRDGSVVERIPRMLPGRYMALSPAGRYLALSTVDAGFVMYRVNPMRKLYHKPGNPKWNYSARFTHRGDRFIIGGIGVLQLIDFSTGETVKDFQVDHVAGGKTLRISSKDTFLAVGDSTEMSRYQVKVFNLSSGERVMSHNVASSVVSLSFSHDESILAYGTGEGEISVMNITNKSVRNRFIGKPGRLMDVQFSKDDKYIVAAYMDGSTMIWDLESSQLIHEVSGAGVKFQSNAILSSYARHYALLRSETDIDLIDTLNGSIYSSIRSREKPFSAWKFSHRNALVVTGDRYGKAALWDAATGKLIDSVQLFDTGIQQVDINTKGNFLIASSEDGTYCLFNRKSRKRLFVHSPVPRQRIYFTGEGYFSSQGNPREMFYLVGKHGQFLDPRLRWNTFFFPNLYTRFIKGESIPVEDKGALISDSGITILKSSIIKDRRGYQGRVTLQLPKGESGRGNYFLIHNGRRITSKTKDVTVKGAGRRRTFTFGLTTGANVVKGGVYLPGGNRYKISNPVYLFNPIKKPFNLHLISIVPGRYRNTSIIPRAGVEKDGNEIISAMSGIGQSYYQTVNTYLLHGDKATLGNIRKILYSISQKADVDDVIFFYFSGKGKAEPYISQGQRFFFLPYDVDLQHLSDSALSGEDLKDFVSRTSSRKIALLLDVVNEGEAGGSQYQNYLPSVANHFGITMLSTRGLNEKMRNGIKQRGLFAHTILKVMKLHRGLTDPTGLVTIQRIFLSARNYYIQENVLSGSYRAPVLYLPHGDIILGYPNE